MHGYLENWCRSGRESALANVPAEYRDICERIDRAKIGWLLSLGECVPELVVSYDPVTDTGAIHPGKTYRDYSGLSGIPGTADLVIQSGPLVSLWDYKTGWAPAVSDSGQLLVLGLAVARARGLSEIELGFARIDPDTGEVKLESVLLTALELDVGAADVKRTWDAVKSGDRVSVNEGPWCKYCPAFTSCPAKTSVAREVFAITKPDVSALTPAQVGETLAKMQTAEKMLEMLKRSLREIVERQPVPMPDGTWAQMQTITATRHKTQKLPETETYSYQKLVYRKTQ